MDFFLISALVLFLFSVFFTYLIRTFSLRKNIVDVPNHRSSHQIPTPRGGGLAFVILFYAAVFVLWFLQIIHSHLLLSLLGGIPVAVVGYCDDVLGVKASWRALVHLLSALWGLAWLGGVPFLYFGQSTFHAPVLFFIFAAFITVWFINLYNFMDGIDGLAGMEAVFVSFVAGSILMASGFYPVAYVCFALTCAVAGFLVFNWSPAKIFMGDIGSGFLGFIFADLMWITNNHHQLSFPIWWILLSVFIIDASYTLIHRMIQKKNWKQAHREHAYQRLVQSGLSHKAVVLSILCINFLVCLPILEIYLHLFRIDFIVFYFILLLSMFWVGWFYITKKYQVC
jgi:Fuc2NAc and GlcNAc transferase